MNKKKKNLWRSKIFFETSTSQIGLVRFLAIESNEPMSLKKIVFSNFYKLFLIYKKY